MDLAPNRFSALSHGPKKVSVNLHKPDRSNPHSIVAKPMFFLDWQEISRN
jgi:hypothetical protein